MKKFLLTLSVTACCLFAKAQLTGMNPNVAGPGQSLQTTVTGPGMFIQASSPSGNIFSVKLINSPTIITMFDISSGPWNNLNVLSTDSFITDYFQIPYNATPGQYQLEVITCDVFDPWLNHQTYTLPNAFTVLPPDGFINGTVYDDANQNGIQDGGELGIQGETLSIMPENYAVSTDASGNYSAPAMNGTHTVQWIPSYYHNYALSSDSASYTVVVSSNTQGGFDFGLKPALVSMSINYSQIGQTVTSVITSNGMFSSAPYLYLEGPNYLYGSGTTFVNSNTITTTFTIPFNTNYIGTYALRVQIGGIYYVLTNAFTVTPFNAGITGSVFYDTNGNGVHDAGELPLENSKVQLTPGNILAFTDASGVYGLGTNNGSYTIQYLPRNYEIMTTPISYNVTVNNNVISGQDFGVQMNPAFDSLSLIVWHYYLRCNTTQSVYVSIKNCGANAADAKLFVVKDPSMTAVITVPPPDYVNGDSLMWLVPNIPAGQDTNFYPTFINPSAGTFVNYSIAANQYDAGNNLLFSTQQTFPHTVLCSYDPNDKRVNPEGIYAPHYTLFGNDLYFTVRFQNTGTDTAFRVIIYDTLDADLDLSTFDFITSSHPVVTELNPANRALKFTFNNIHLPDSNINEPMSHGEVTYRIHCNSGLPANTMVNNTAYIVFDLNTPVITNTSFNTMVYTIPVGLDEVKNSADGVVIYPNPFDQSTWIIFRNEKNEKFDLAITDPNGRKVFEKEISSDRYLFEKGSLGSGLYFYKLSNKNRTINFSGKFAAR